MAKELEIMLAAGVEPEQVAKLWCLRQRIWDCVREQEAENHQILELARNRLRRGEFARHLFEHGYVSDGAPAARNTISQRVISYDH